MTKSVGVHETKTHLSRLLKDVAAGEEVVITRRGEEAARLVAIRAPHSRTLGVDRGRFVVPENFDEPLSGEMSAALEA
jgi:prevent-host-death family protein